jgi:hypothetical protein
MQKYDNIKILQTHALVHLLTGINIAVFFLPVQREIVIVNFGNSKFEITMENILFNHPEFNSMI